MDRRGRVTWAAVVLCGRRTGGQGLAERGLAPIRNPWRNELKLDAVTILRQLFHGQSVELPNHRAMIGELLSLEQRVLPSGRPRFEASPGGTDDYAHALLALAHHLVSGAIIGGFSLIA